MKIDNPFFSTCRLWRGEQRATISRKEAVSSPRRKREKGRIFSFHLEREYWERRHFLRVDGRKEGVLAKPDQSSTLRRWARLSSALSERGVCPSLTEAKGEVFVYSLPQNQEYSWPIEKEENEISASSSSRLRREERSDGERNPSSPARTIVITSGKGGVGKTTATANLGMSMARLGYRVALIDADIGLRNLDLLLGLENRILYTAIDILDGQCRLDQALIRDKRLKNLSLLSISKSRQRYNVTRKNMENLVESIGRLGYHFILIDCPAGIDVGFINAISSAKEALIITTPEITAIRDADRVAGLLEANNVYDVKLLVNRVRPDMIQQNNMMSVQDVQEMLAIPLLGAIPEDKNVIISTNRGEPLVLKKKLTLSAIAFENAARRLIGRQDYFIDLVTPQKGIVQRIQEIISREARP
uniref:Putative septum site-determining protein MinD n=1 Tax=Elliptochloris bilobata TaxID=381761 RepID=A0A097KQZ1_9CHLO|nr:septum site-determining protein [Elliptochloris bilobata]AIT95574.1 septum site-determining protein [Elliptochloris bilobata]